MNRRLHAWQKSKQIRNLENQRGEQIARIQFRFEKSSRGTVITGSPKAISINGKAV